MTRNSSSPKPIMDSHKHWWALGVVLSVTLFGGVIYGDYSNRWGVPSDLEAAAAQLGTMPAILGSWKLVEELTISQTALDMLECAGHTHRRYVDSDSGREVDVFIIVGPAGPTAVHTPEVCYSSRAYERSEERKKVGLANSGDSQDTFWFVEFSSRNVMASRLRVYYAWSEGASWNASESPRFEFGGAPLLYKIQLATTDVPRPGNEGTDAGHDFLVQLANSEWSISPN
ncbi:MAG: exosortase-associated EpsI family protein [Aeoliella sp.]